MLNNENANFFKKVFSFWDKLDTKQKALLLEQSNLVRYKSNQTIHNGDNDCIGVILVKTGCVRTYMLSDKGKDITLYRLYPGEVCILSASCILQNITFDVHIDAEEESEILLVPSSVFSQLKEENIYVENFSYKVVVDRFSDVMWAMEQILFMSFDKRLAIFLLDESAKSKSSTLQLTHEQIAKYIGSAREVVSRMLKYFSQEGLVELSRGGVTITDSAKLKALIKL